MVSQALNHLSFLTIAVHFYKLGVAFVFLIIVAEIRSFISEHSCYRAQDKPVNAASLLGSSIHADRFSNTIVVHREIKKFAL